MSTLVSSRQGRDGYPVRFSGPHGATVGTVYFGMSEWWGFCLIERKEVTLGCATRDLAADALSEHYLMKQHHKEPK